MPGDIIISYDAATGKLYPEVVQRIVYFTVSESYKINNQVGTDGNELFYTERGWVAASNLKVGDEILNPVNSQWIAVYSVTHSEGQYVVYDVIGNSGNSFMVDGGYLADTIST